MSCSSGGDADGGGARRPSGGCRQTCISVNRASSASNRPHMVQSFETDFFPGGRLNVTDEEGCETAFPPWVSSYLCWQLTLIVGLALPLLLAGTFFFINGFFLSRDDLSYVSNGRSVPFPPLFPHLHPTPLFLNKEEGVYYMQSDNTPSNSTSASESYHDKLQTPLHPERFLAPQLDQAEKEAEICGTAECASSWVSVTPYDRVVILLIDAMRFDFLLWDPEASNACGKDRTFECEAAPPNTRPFYRNRMPFVHDLLRRSDPELRQYLTFLMGLQPALNSEDGKGAKTETSPSAKFSTENPESSFSSAEESLPRNSLAAPWGGNRFSRLYLFEADPPTATTQRLTGIATGSMPSFFSVRESFSASAVNVDSIVMQLKAADKISVAIGDDTWKSCFGHLLTRTYPFPSLNIQDLHTADDGVEAELPVQFRKGDWSFLVGHTLGVDHVGHASVLDSHLMKEKLAQVNDLFKNTLKMILNETNAKGPTGPPTTLFLAFGDHGMTEAGAHGGSTSEEVDAGLLSFSPLPAILSPQAAQALSPATRLMDHRLPMYLHGHGAFRPTVLGPPASVRGPPASGAASPTPSLGYGARRVRQVGLAPTLSLLLGLPIPFNSMGPIIADMVPKLASFVQECAAAEARSLGLASACDKDRRKPCNVKSKPLPAGEATALKVRCSDLAYLTQLHHITAWQEHRTIEAYAKETGNDAVLTDPQFSAAKKKWLRLYGALYQEIKALPPAAHTHLKQNKLEFDQVASVPLRPSFSNSAEAELLSAVARLGGDAAYGKGGKVAVGLPKLERGDEEAFSLSSLLPSLVPYLLAATEFSQEALQASVRQLGTFNMLMMVCGMLLVLSSLLILLFAVLALSQPPKATEYQTPQARIAQGFPLLAAVCRWLSGSACIWAALWVAAWAASKVCLHLSLGPGTAMHAVVWHQLPFLCMTGFMCSVVVPFARCAPSLSAHLVSLCKGFGRGTNGEAESLVREDRAACGFVPMLRTQLCGARLWLGFFDGGTPLCCVTLLVLCIVPFADCFVVSEWSLVRFLIGIFCIAGGLAVLATPSRSTEKTRITSAFAALMLCVRIGSAFDPSESSGERQGSEGSALQIDCLSSSALFMFCICCVAGKRDIPLVSSLLRPAPSRDLDGASAEVSRFRVLGFRPLKGCQGPRSCQLERAVFLFQGAAALLWFASPHTSKLQQGSAGAMQGSQSANDMPLHDAVAWLWSAFVLPFVALDAVGEACLARWAPQRPWVFPGPLWMVKALPAQLKEGQKVKLMPLLNIFLPWAVYLAATAFWLRLALTLCHLKKRENNLSTLQLRRAEAETTAMGEDSPSGSGADEGSHEQFDCKMGGRSFLLWRVEVWQYFSHYLLLTALNPLCMYAVILGRGQLLPLLLCCIKWRVLLFLSRVLVLSPAYFIGGTDTDTACKCFFCRATAAVATESSPASYTSDSERTSLCTNEDAIAKRVSNKPQHAGARFLLNDASVCVMAALLALDTFFATGHRTKLSALPIEAGFIGLLEFHPVWSMVTSFLHTNLGFFICCPLIFMIAFLRMAHGAASGGKQDAEELQGHTTDAVIQNTLVKVGKLAFGILSGLTLRHLFSLVSLTALRSHLFIWDLFAVKFLYDATVLFLVYLLVVLTLAFVSIGTRRAAKVLRLAA